MGRGSVRARKSKQIHQDRRKEIYLCFASYGGSLIDTQMHDEVGADELWKELGLVMVIAILPTASVQTGS